MEIEIASTIGLSPGKMLGIEKNGKSILLANVNGTFYAIGNICTHMGCKISEGSLVGDRVQCPCHGSTFDVKTGAVIRGPAKNPEPSYQVKIVGDRVLASL